MCAAVSTMEETQASTSRKVEVFWEWLKEKGVVEPGKTLFRVAEVREVHHICPPEQRCNK